MTGSEHRVGLLGVGYGPLLRGDERQLRRVNRPFSPGALTGALGHNRSLAGGVQIPRVGVAWLDFHSQTR
jgi:hypothetical protein